MSKVRVTKEFRFEGAHALLNYDGKCRHIHGHSYILYVTVKGTPANNPASAKDGMIMDFTDLKAIVNSNIVDKFDHALVLRSSAKLVEEIARDYENIVVVDFQPTCENLISYFAEVIKKHLPKEVELYSIKLYETATSYVEWYAEENQ
ncbi:MAG: 6-carboxytetrahydropterin synthase [Bacteroidales bacterium]